jgi:hypothetical protein
MRGCLSVLVLAALFIGVAAWFGGPTIAGALVTSGLAASGLDARRTDVRVEADPPIAVATGRADRVVVVADDVDWNGLEARSLDLTLEDVDLLGRRAATVEGRMIGVELPNVEPAGSLATVRIEGPADGATTTVTIDGGTFEAMAMAAFEERLGVEPDSATLEEPDVIRVRAGPVELAGSMEVAPDGSIEVDTPLGTVTVVGSNDSLPLTLTDVGVDNGALVLTGTFDLNDLLR